MHPELPNPQPESPFARTEMLLGAAAMARLAESRVAIFGIGGVGGHCAEALARCGVGSLLLIDSDKVAVTNINRQAVAAHSTIGQLKVDVMRARILDINPSANVETIPAFYSANDDLGVWSRPLDLVIDAIDTVSAKVHLAARAQALGITCVSCMGAGNKLDPAAFEAADLFNTSVCPLCRAMRKQAREAGIASLRVIYSKEMPVATPATETKSRPIPGSIAFVTASAGLLLAGEAVRMLLASTK